MCTSFIAKHREEECEVGAGGSPASWPAFKVNNICSRCGMQEAEKEE